MAIISKPTRISNPLAVAGNFQPNPNIDRLVKFLNTVPGTDKILMFIQYFSKIVIWFFNRTGKESLAQRITNLSNPVSDFRILLRFYGLLPLIQWMIHIEHHPPVTPLLLHIERIQNFTMILYYPLEHIWWLAYHKIIDITDTRLNKIGIWSCRFWAAYVILQFWHLAIEWKLYKRQSRNIIKKVDGDEDEIRKEKRAIKAGRERIIRDTIVNIGYLPLTMHWSIENSSFPDIGVGIFGTLASVYQIIGAWRTANE
ncbi:peroxisomal biogenesis factor 11 [Glomus cerebriforme]|uniref:Peroxisomal biogenesis factor 11 n=1 Tax=Glomus cerebriforme TaxID=658196 RepID=A0A397T9S7_9GLOM|nr:peroxisomal biogenesis factor 11 [Glomus cerebriforme]